MVAQHSDFLEAQHDDDACTSRLARVTCLHTGKSAVLRQHLLRRRADVRKISCKPSLSAIIIKEHCLKRRRVIHATANEQHPRSTRACVAERVQRDAQQTLRKEASEWLSAHMRGVKKAPTHLMQRREWLLLRASRCWPGVHDDGCEAIQHEERRRSNSHG